jgi:hypothetical protein
MVASRRLRPLLRTAAVAAAIARRHYLTLISGAIVSGVFVLAMTSSSFGYQRSAASVRGGAPTPTVRLAFPDRLLPSEQWLIYYLVVSKEQRNLVIEAMSSDSAARYTGGASDETAVEFFIIDNVLEEAYVGRLINNAVERAMSEGINLKVVDLRP